MRETRRQTTIVEPRQTFIPQPIDWKHVKQYDNKKVVEVSEKPGMLLATNYSIIKYPFIFRSFKEGTGEADVFQTHRDHVRIRGNYNGGED
jgi:hypothetical protein